MSRVVALAGVDEAKPGAPMLIWGLVIGATIGIFVGTLLINPSRKRRT